MSLAGGPGAAERCGRALPEEIKALPAAGRLRKMARVAVCLALIAPAAGLVAPAAPAASTALKAEAAASLKGMSGGVQAGDPMPGEGPWDPIGFSKLHENIQGSEHAGVVPSQQWMH